MSDSVSTARPLSGNGTVSRPQGTSSAGRLTRPDGASRVVALDTDFDATLAAASAARSILSLSEAEAVEPVRPVTPVGPDRTAPSFATLADAAPNGRGLLSGSIPVLLAESRAQEIRVLAQDPGLADVSRAAEVYRDTAQRIDASRRQV